MSRPGAGSDSGLNARSSPRPAARYKESTMKYMLMMNTPSGGPYQIARWPQQDIQAHIAS